jgi:hypothetical protein
MVFPLPFSYDSLKILKIDLFKETTVLGNKKLTIKGVSKIFKLGALNRLA